jgi:hypothetical protein
MAQSPWCFPGQVFSFRVHVAAALRIPAMRQAAAAGASANGVARRAAVEDAKFVGGDGGPAAHAFMFRVRGAATSTIPARCPREVQRCSILPLLVPELRTDPWELLVATTAYSADSFVSLTH